MKITYDKEVDAMYIYFKKSKVSRTVSIGRDFKADVDKNSNIVGLEIIGASRKIGGNKSAPSIAIGKKLLKLPVGV